MCSGTIPRSCRGHEDARLHCPRAGDTARPAADGRAFGALDEFSRNRLDEEMARLCYERD
ncbi:hypothetical protein RAA17_15520 [Komagataeibacter rhaeticus]|nr:hypothetical protein [Komagataeibacter rhaeticus]